MKLRFLVLLCAGMIVGAVSARAVPFIWTGASTSTGLVTETVNWDGSGPTGFGGEDLTFGNLTGSQFNVVIPGSLAVNNLTFDGTSRPGYTFNGTESPTLTLSGNVTVSTASSNITFNSSLGIALSAGAHTIDIVTGPTVFIFSSIGEASAASVIKNGGGSLVLSNANTYTGGTTVNAGRLTLLNSSGSGTGTGNVTVNGGTFAIGGGVTGGSLSSNILNNSIVEFAHSSENYTYSGVISGTGTLNKTGAGTLTLTGANTYTGDTSLSVGTLTIGADNTLPSLSKVIMGGSSSTLDVANNQTVAGLSGTSISSVVLASTKTLTVNTTSNLTFNGVISGGGVFAKTGTGTTILSGANTYTGGTTVNAGRLTLLNTSGSATGTGNVTVNGGTLAIGGATAGGSITGNISNNGTVEFAHSSGSTSYGGVISGTGAVTKTNASSLTLTGANTYTGTTGIFNGTLVIGAVNALPTTTALTLGPTAVLDVQNDQTIERLFGNLTSQIQIATGQTFMVDLADNATSGTGYAGTISGAGKLRIGGPANNWIMALSGTNTYTGGTQIDAGGELQIGAMGTTGSIVGDVLNNGRLSFGRTNRYIFDGIISGSGVVAHHSGETWLNGTNTYTGGTQVSGGTLVTSNSSGFGTGTITLTGGKIGATGGISISNPLVITSGGVVGTGTFNHATFGTNSGFGPAATADHTIGTLSFHGLTLASGGTYGWNLTNPTSGPGSGWDLVTITSSGVFTVAATAESPFTLALMSLSADGTLGTASGFTAGTSYSWMIFDFTNSSLVGFDPTKFQIDSSGFMTNVGPGTFTLSNNGSHLFLNFTPVPEPSTYVLMAMGSLLLAAHLRRKRA